MIKNFTLQVCGTLALAAFAQAAQAAPITAQPAALTVSGNVTLVYIGSDANDSSSLSVQGGPDDVFCNHCSGASAAGATVYLGYLNGPLDLELHNSTVANVFDTANPASDGKYYANIQSSYDDLGLSTIPDAALSVIASLTTTASTLSYVGFEDRAGGDYDYNDFVFAVISTPPEPEGDVTILPINQDPVALIDPDAPVITNAFSARRSSAAVAPVPEPASLALFGAGLIGFVARRRRA